MKTKANVKEQEEHLKILVLDAFNSPKMKNNRRGDALCSPVPAIISDKEQTSINHTSKYRTKLIGFWLSLPLLSEQIQSIAPRSILPPSPMLGTFLCLY